MALQVQIYECADPSSPPLRWQGTMSTVEDTFKRTDIDGRLAFVFLDSSDLASSAGAYQQIFRAFNIPAVFWHKLTQDVSGFFWAGRDDRSQTTDAQYTTTFRFLVKKNEAAC